MLKRRAPEETAPETSERKDRPRLSKEFILFLILSIVFATAVALALSPLMAIDQVEVQGQRALTQDKVLALAGEPIGQNLFSYPKTKAALALTSHPYVESATIHRQLPHKLVIQLEERRPVGILLSKGYYLQFSDKGLLLDTTRTLKGSNLPLVTGIALNKVPPPGEPIRDETFQEVLKIVTSMSDDLLDNIQELNIAKNKNILAYTSSGIEVRIGDATDIQKRMQALDDIMKQIVLSGTLPGEIEYIDIRLQKAPVIKLKNDNDIDSFNEQNDPSMPSMESEAQTVVGTTEAVQENDPTATNGGAQG